MGTGFLKKKKEMKKLQQQFTKMQEDMNQIEATGEAGNGLIKITLTGENRMKDIYINPECIDPKDADGMQDLIRMAYNDAINKLSAKTKNMEGSIIPGGFPF